MIQISLAAARTNAGLTQAEVAAKIRKSKATIVNWEKGKTEIDQANLAQLSEIYAVPVDAIRLPIILTKSQE